ncbi:hypothetical protein BD414DRAFT_211379 [Trametes punicea]|nr:hypothetical protein BD414DRAFT_211379 [Trametes punicea]
MLGSLIASGWLWESPLTELELPTPRSQALLARPKVLGPENVSPQYHPAPSAASKRLTRLSIAGRLSLRPSSESRLPSIPPSTCISPCLPASNGRCRQCRDRFVCGPSASSLHVAVCTCFSNSSNTPSRPCLSRSRVVSHGRLHGNHLRAQSGNGRTLRIAETQTQSPAYEVLSSLLAAGLLSPIIGLWARVLSTFTGLLRDSALLQHLAGSPWALGCARISTPNSGRVAAASSIRKFQGCRIIREAKNDAAPRV